MVDCKSRTGTSARTALDWSWRGTLSGQYACLYGRFFSVSGRSLLRLPCSEFPAHALNNRATSSTASFLYGSNRKYRRRRRSRAWGAAAPICSASGCHGRRDYAVFAIVVTDPSFHDHTNAFVGALIGLWIIVSVSLTGRGFIRPWFEIFARIFGSWLIAIGVLYGASALFQKYPRGPLPEPEPLPDLDRSFPDINRGYGEPGNPSPSLRDPK